ncbi:MAG: carboxypeptidase-like regulatory domain-containing protein [Bacteroidota bacterium]
MKKFLLYTAIVLFIIPVTAKAQFETARDSVVQLYGVIMTADSLVGIPAISIMVKGQNRGTITNNDGVFSIVVLKGDEVEFTHVSYKSKTILIPRNLDGNQYSVVQLWCRIPCICRPLSLNRGQRPSSLRVILSTPKSPTMILK